MSDRCQQQVEKGPHGGFRSCRNRASRLFYNALEPNRTRQLCGVHARWVAAPWTQKTRSPAEKGESNG